MRLGTQLNLTDSEFLANAEAAQKQLAEVQNLAQSVTNPEADDQIKRHRDRGKLFVRDRISLLLDPGSPFLEIGLLTGHEIYEDTRIGCGLVTGIGRIEGRECMVVANDATVKGGTYFPLTVKKHLRAQEIAFENYLPCVYLVDSGGAYLPLQDQLFADRDHFGRIFFNQARMSARRIPQIAVVMGSCTAGGAYVPAMSDETIIVENQGTIFLGGPPLVKAATGEEISAEDLGGAEVHCKISGVADHLAKNDGHALQIARRIVSDLGKSTVSKLEHGESRVPFFDPNEMLSLIPTDSKKYFPMREILARITDESEFDEFKAEYGTSLICGFARIGGYLVGIIANDGILFSESSLKGVHFIQLCNQRAIPLLFVQNIVGFMVGKEYEHGGIAKDGAKLVNAVACSEVPKLTVIVGGSFGAGNYGMAGRAYQPRMLFTWPNSRISVMGPEQAAQVLTQVRAESYKNKKASWSEKDAEKYRKEILDTYNHQASALYSTARLWDDGIIDPRKTRDVITLALSACRHAPVEETKFGVFRT